jgi:hypothetical protein
MARCLRGPTHARGGRLANATKLGGSTDQRTLAQILTGQAINAPRSASVESLGPQPPLSGHDQFVTWSAVVWRRAFGRFQSPAAVVAEVVDALA